MDYIQSSPDYVVCGILQARIVEWVVFPSSRVFPNPGIESISPSLQEDFSPAELPGKSQKSFCFELKEDQESNNSPWRTEAKTLEKKKLKKTKTIEKKEEDEMVGWHH